MQNEFQLPPSTSKLVESLAAWRIVSVETPVGTVHLQVGRTAKVLGASLTEELTASDKDEVEKIVRRMVRNGDLDDYTLKSIQGALTQLFKALYTRRGTWKSDVSLKMT